MYAMITSILGNEMTVNIYVDNKETDSQQTWLIPVGTDVVTKLGTTTSFSRLASGDYIRMLVQNSTDSQDILKIWIVN
jgi:ERCC4-type nuclease